MEIATIILITLVTILILFLFFVFCYFFIKEKNKKYEKKEQEKTIEDKHQKELEAKKELQEDIFKLTKEIISLKTQSENKDKDLFNNLEILKKATGKMDFSQLSSDKKIIELTEKIEKVNKIVAKTHEGGEKLTNQVEKLNDIFKNNYSRGKLGETSLYFILESVLGKDNVIFKRQYKMQNGKICDAFIFVKNNNIAIDSKFPYENFSKMLKLEKNTLEFQETFKSFKKDVQNHIKKIAEDYISKADKTSSAAIYLPSQPIFEFLYSEQKNESLLKFAHENKIVILAPNTLPVFLRIVNDHWKRIQFDNKQNQIKEYLEKIFIEFQRFAERWKKLKKHTEALTEDVINFDITTEKITKKLEKAKDLKLQKPDEKIEKEIE